MGLSPTVFRGNSGRNCARITLAIVVVFGIRARIVEIKAFILP
jgi:hypothetical protein